MLTKIIETLKEKFMPEKAEESKLTPAEQYKKEREEIEKHFIDAVKVGDSHERMSPSGKYKLVTSQYKTKDGCWNYSRGQVYRHDDTTGNDDAIADVKRNYGSFEFCWVEDHPNGHSYLVAGEDYQGQTFVELDTGKRRDVTPDGWEKGWGFCWTGVHPSPDKKLLAVVGCYWGGPFDTVFFDFRDPMTDVPEVGWWDDLSLKELGLEAEDEDLERKEAGARWAKYWEKWEKAGEILVGKYIETCKSDGVPLKDLPDGGDAVPVAEVGHRIDKTVLTAAAILAGLKEKPCSK